MKEKRNIRRRSFAVTITALLAAAAISLTGCTTYDNFINAYFGEETEDVVRIGVFQPLSGSYAEQGQLEIQGIELAHELFPEALSKPVKLIYADNKSDISLAESAANELVEARASVVLGSYGSTLSLVGGDVFAEARIPAIGITCTNPIVTAANNFYFRVCFVDSFQGNAAAKYVYEAQLIDRAVVMKEAENDYASAMAQMFTEKMISLTESEEAILAVVEYEKGTEDFSRQLLEIAALGAPVVYLPSTADDGLKILEQAADLGITSEFIGTDNWDDDAFLQYEGATFTSLYQSETTFTEMSEVFLAAYREKYGEDATPESAVALGFDAYLLAVNGINEAGTALNGEAIAGCIGNTREYPGATGSITLNTTGDPIKSVGIMKVESGAFVHKHTAEPSWGS